MSEIRLTDVDVFDLDGVIGDNIIEIKATFPYGVSDCNFECRNEDCDGECDLSKVLHQKFFGNDEEEFAKECGRAIPEYTDLVQWCCEGAAHEIVHHLKVEQPAHGKLIVAIPGALMWIFKQRVLSYDLLIDSETGDIEICRSGEERGWKWKKN